ncbi:DUF6681 family protein [Lentilactobacillus farraginis]|uniref:Uncharacterized protein n=2 Tax=Lentilactobacillus farraginis DSM 18382 = JCM 14108 TaxID=1423743 RepID=X0PLX5_9LACO|nr:DUF6681 family protein [Lentilactobacillus farraginis]GAF37811.1 hypothetical protein JCM14108_2874 [Lentilactobacillus farraginis DSM 18382 = JCM 14108]
MFSFLDMVNHYLGYFNINVTVKSRIYTILGFLGNIYLFYISFRFLQNKYYSKGLLLLAVSLILLYFLICNFFYYFTKKQPWFDISPKLARMLHLQPHEKEIQANSKMGNTILQEPYNRKNNAANGIFDEQHVLPAKLAISPAEQLNLNRLVAQMERQQLFRADYNGMSDRKVYELLKINGGKPIYAIGKGVMLPYFEMKRQGESLIVYAGMNQAETYPVGSIKRVGLQSIRSVDLSDLRLYLASVELFGGPYKEIGRAGVLEHPQDYTLRASVAYKKQA